MNFVDGQYGTKYWDLFEQRIDETIQAVKNQQIPKLRRISLHVTNKCNFNCIYCNEKHNSKELDFQQYKKIIDEYAEMGGGVLHITGGEPSLVTYIDKAIEYAYNKQNIVVNMNTNCFKLIKDSSYSKISRLKISFDTADKDKFNYLVQRKNAFQRVLSNLNHIKSLTNSPIISITCTVNAQNIKDLIEYTRFYYENMHVYALFFSIYKGDNKKLMFLQSHRKLLFEIIYPTIKKIMQSNNDFDSLWLLENSHSQNTYQRTNRFPENKLIPCYLSLSELSIYETGKVSHCSHLSRDGIFDSNIDIKKQTLKEICNTKLNLYKSYPLHLKCLYGCNLKLCKFNQDCHKKLINLDKD